MNGFRRKLRQFRKDWVRKSRSAKSPAKSSAASAFPDAAPPLARRSLLGFLFNADDTPRGARGERPWPRPEPAMARAGFPRFRNPANDGAPRAA